MKIVLAIGASVVFGILSAIVAVFLILPVAVVAAVVVIMAKGGGLRLELRLTSQQVSWPWSSCLPF